jgi:hypothetical protein
MSLFFNLVPYILAVATIALSAVDLYQKREEYKSRRLRQSVIALFTFAGVLTIFALYHDNAEREADKRKAEKDNSALQMKLDSVKAELLNTQKAMAPGPKAALDFSFIPFENQTGIHGMVPRKAVDLPINVDGSVKVDFSVLNLTDVYAESFQITLIICDQCKFAKEVGIYANFGGQPGVKMLEKAPGEEDTHRHLPLDGLSAAGYLPGMRADIIPPPNAAQFDIGIGYACKTCVVGGKSFGTVHVLRRSQQAR